MDRPVSMRGTETTKQKFIKQQVEFELALKTGSLASLDAFDVANNTKTNYTSH